MLDASFRNGSIAACAPVQVGADIVAIFRFIETMPDKVQWVQREIARRLGAGRDPALARACSALATMIDADPSTFDEQPYHNRQHYCEVALSAYFLCKLDQTAVNASETQLILLSALMHDVVHDGRSHPPFHLERASVMRAMPLIISQGVGQRTQARVEAMVLSTDPACGTRFVVAANAFHNGQGDAPAVPTEAPELARLLHDPSLARAARLLCEADILPSIGLTPDHAMQLQDRLSSEWGRALGLGDKLSFVRIVLDSGILGEFFKPNVLALRSHLEGYERAAAQA